MYAHNIFPNIDQLSKLNYQIVELWRNKVYALDLFYVYLSVAADRVDVSTYLNMLDGGIFYYRGSRFLIWGHNLLLHRSKKELITSVLQTQFCVASGSA